MPWQFDPGISIAVQARHELVWRDLEHLHHGDANGSNRPDWPATGSTGDAATPTAWPFTAYLLPLSLPCCEENFTPNFDSAQFRVDNAEFTVSGFAGSRGPECLRWGGCRDPRPFTRISTGPTPVGVPVAANGWRCS